MQATKKGNGPHLCVVISPHGFGHLAQTAVVLNTLLCERPDLRCTIINPYDKSLLKNWLAFDFTHEARALDIGMVNVDAIAVDPRASANIYQELHENWQQKITGEAQWLKTKNVDMVLSNIAYLPLAAARHAGITSIGLSSLNWADIYHSYCHDTPTAEAIYAQILTSYQRADALIQLTPGMPMPMAQHNHQVGPVSRQGCYRKQELLAHYQLEPDSRLVLIGMGGIPVALDYARWPRLEGVVFLASEPVPARTDFIQTDLRRWSWIDLLASSDALITKPGYGSFVEAAVHGVPFLYVPRGDWPEEGYLTAWAEAHGRCLPIERSLLEKGELQQPLQALWRMPPVAAPTPNGAHQAAAIVSGYLPA